MTMPENFDALWDYAHPEVSEARFREHLPRVAGDVPNKLELETQIARAEGLQRRFDDAHRTLDQVATELDAVAADVGPRPRIRLLLERGRVFNSAGDPGDARPLFVEAWERARAAGEDALAVDAAHMVAIVETGDARREWNARALELAERSTEPRARRWRASLLNNIGWDLHDRGEHAAALEHFERAVEARRENGDERELTIAHWCVARALRSLGRVDDALGRQWELLEKLRAAGETDGYVEEEIAECLWSLGREKESAPYYQRAHEILSRDPWIAAQEPDRITRLAQRARG